MNMPSINPIEVPGVMDQEDPGRQTAPVMDLYGGSSVYPTRNRRSKKHNGLLGAGVHYVRGNLLLCLLGTLYLAGLLAGTLLVSRSNPQTRELLDIVLGGYMEKRGVQSFALLAISSFGSVAVTLLLLFFCGFCTISQPIILLIPMFKGLGYGFTMGALYAEQGIGALKYVGTLIFPTLFLGALLFLCASKTSFLLSVRLLRTAITPSDQDARFRMRRYCVKYFTYFVCGALIALLDAALVCRFGSLFTL